MILLPVPKHVAQFDGQLLLHMDTAVVLDAGCPDGTLVYATQLQQEAAASAGLDLTVLRGAARKGDIRLSTDPTLGAQHYRLQVHTDGALLCGGSLSALGWAVQTLRQLLREYAGLLPCVEIDDQPMLENRGYYHDVTRGRVQTLDNLKKLADTLCFYKMNQLQLYIEHTYLYRDLTELWRDDTPLTAQEIMELDDYCWQRGIELVPSIATFGHLYKLLGSQGHAHLCELPDAAGQPFGFRARMGHHTVNVSDPAAIELVKRMIEEFMQLFRTDKFNICADETFDLCRGKSKALGEEKGVGTVYFEYISQLFDFLQQKGKVPMFWGDIIVGTPALCKQLPPQAICLTWGYSPTQREDEVRIMHEAGATQYVCPGVCGWNTWINALPRAYENIRLMTTYAKKYDAVGMLNTDWGDFGHINHPVFSVPGLIYGAAFSWSEQVPSYDEINRQISILEFGDASGKLVGLWGQAFDDMIFSWHQAVTLREWHLTGHDRAEMLEAFAASDLTRVAAANRRLKALEPQLRRISRSMDSASRWVVQHTHVSLTMTRLWNQVGLALQRMQKGRKVPGAADLAAQLERALYHYRLLWQQNSKEGDLRYITEVFCWYADLLRRHAA